MSMLDDRAVDPAAENAELRRRLDEALAREQASAEILQVINASPGDLAPVFDAILEKARALCGVAYGSLQVYDGRHFRAVATHGLPGDFVELLRQSYAPVGNGGSGRLVAGERFHQIADVAEIAADPDAPARNKAAAAAGMRTVLFVPLRKDGTLLGLITAGRTEVRRFTEPEIALLEGFAAQVVIAMENARLLTETREALEQQTATAEVLQVINSSPGDLAPVFEAMLDKAMRLCGAAFGMMNTYDGERFHTAAERGVPIAYAEFRRSRPLAHAPGTAPARIVAGEDVVHNADLKAEEVYKKGNPNRRALVDLCGARSHVAVALRRDGKLLGMFTIYRREVRPFTDKQIALLQNFAAQAVIAMENARLFAETREALEQQTATAEVLQVINSSPGNLAPVFDGILEKALRLCDASFGTFHIFNGEAFTAGAQRGLPGKLAENLSSGRPLRPQEGSLLHRLVFGEDLVQVEDISASTLPSSLGGREALISAGARTMLWIALRKEGALYGAINIYRQEIRAFTDKQIALLQNFAAQAVIAMENARLLTETREALEQQTATAEVLRVINASPANLGPVFDAILERAHAVCGVAHGGLCIFDGEYFRAVATRGLPQDMMKVLRESFHGNYYHQELVRGARYAHVPDMLALDPAQLDAIGSASAAAGIRTALLIPLRKDATLRGFISASRREVRPFSEKEIALLENFAAQAVIAMENARLLGELRQRTEEVAELNRGLEARVAEQVEELGRVGKLKRFLAPQLAELIVSQGDENILESHRREIVVVFCDLRGFTAFAETAEPEEVLELLRDYHAALGPLVGEFEGTLDHFSGDGIMVFFNDPVPCPDPAERAVKMAMAMRGAAGELIAAWRRRGRELGFGVGIAQGYATLGQIGFADRSDYTAIGTVCNLAARLCGEAKDGQILLSRRVAAAVEETAPLEEIGMLTLKGLSQPVATFNVLA